MAFAPPALVAGPARAPLPFGLFSVVDFRSNSDRWEIGGVQFETLGAPGYRIFDDVDCDDAAPEGSLADPSGGMPTETSLVFTVQESAQCTPVGKTPEQLSTLAEQRLLAYEEQAVEDHFWKSAQGQSLRGTSDLGATAYTIRRAVGQLEHDFAYFHGGQGVLHLPRVLAPASAEFITRSGGTMRTNLGTPVVFGTGYDGSSPAGAAPADDTTWIYITGPIFGYRSEVRTDRAFDQAINDYETYASRSYVMAYDTQGALACLVDTATS